MVHHHESGTRSVAQAQQGLAECRHGARIVLVLIVRGVERVENNDLGGGGARGGYEVVQALRGTEQMSGGACVYQKMLVGSVARSAPLAIMPTEAAHHRYEHRFEPRSEPRDQARAQRQYSRRTANGLANLRRQGATVPNTARTGSQRSNPPQPCRAPYVPGHPSVPQAERQRAPALATWWTASPRCFVAVRTPNNGAGEAEKPQKLTLIEARRQRCRQQRYERYQFVVELGRQGPAALNAAA